MFMKYRDPIVITIASMGLAYVAYAITHDAVALWLSALATGFAAGIGAWASTTLLRKAR